MEKAAEYDAVLPPSVYDRIDFGYVRIVGCGGGKKSVIDRAGCNDAVFHSQDPAALAICRQGEKERIINRFTNFKHFCAF